MGIGSCLTQGSLRVPLYQRSYSWEIKQVNDLFNDIKESIQSNREDYFLGSVVIARDQNAIDELVDGQQRIATTTILLVAIRDFLIKNNDERRANWIEQKFLFEQDFESLAILPKLKLNIEDNEYFIKNILTRPINRQPISPSRTSNIKLTSAFKESIKFVKENISSSDTKSITRWITFLEKNVKIIQIRVEDYSYAYSIFETLNDRGLDLTVSDLLKNFLYANAGERYSELLSNWSKMSAHLDSLDSDSPIVTFIRHAWASKNGLTRERELFQKIRNKIKTPQEAIELSRELAKDAIQYSALLNSENELWNEYSDTVSESIKILVMLKMQQNRPLLISILNYFPKPEVEKSINTLLNWAIRFIVTGSLGSSGLETNFSNNASKVTSKEIKNTEELFSVMKEIIPTDEEFKKAFSIFTIKRPELARYLLQKLEITKRAEQQPEFLPNTNGNQVNLEHILPKNPNADWNSISEELHSVLYRRLGNMCLLQGSINSKIGNKSFTEKTKVYKKSSFLLTKSISEYSTWMQDDIELRQTEMAELALKAWPYKPIN